MAEIEKIEAVLGAITQDVALVPSKSGSKNLAPLLAELQTKMNVVGETEEDRRTNREAVLSNVKEGIVKAHEGQLDQELAAGTKELIDGATHGAVTGLLSGEMFASVTASIYSIVTSLVFKLEPVRKTINQTQNYFMSKFKGNGDCLEWSEAGELAEKQLLVDRMMKNTGLSKASIEGLILEAETMPDVAAPNTLVKGEEVAQETTKEMDAMTRVDMLDGIKNGRLNIEDLLKKNKIDNAYEDGKIDALELTGKKQFDQELITVLEKSGVALKSDQASGVAYFDTNQIDQNHSIPLVQQAVPTASR